MSTDVPLFEAPCTKMILAHIADSLGRGTMTSGARFRALCEAFPPMFRAETPTVDSRPAFTSIEGLGGGGVAEGSVGVMSERRLRKRLYCFLPVVLKLSHLPCSVPF